MRKAVLTTALVLLSHIAMAQIDYKVEVFDTIGSPILSDTKDLYAIRDGVFTFRQNLHRAPRASHIELDTITDITIDWSFKTAVDMEPTPYGTWFGGTGWTGQPLYVKWNDMMMELFKDNSPHLTQDFDNQEVIVGSLCGSVYFINFNSGKSSRAPINVGNTIKGTVSLDAIMNGNLYVGHGIPKRSPFGFSVFSLFSHSQTYVQGRDGGAFRGWGAFDSSPVTVGGFLFWPGENGSFYKFSTINGRVKPHSVLRYKVAGKSSLGVENSLAVYKNFGYFGDNGGTIMCVDLNNLKPVWSYDNHDDIDATIVVDTVGGAFVYVGSEVDKQGAHGFAHIAKLDAITGKPVWRHSEPCSKKYFNPEKSLDGGMFSTPLLGDGDCKSLIFISLAVNKSTHGGEIIAFDRETGKISHRTRTGNYLWSSAVSFVSSKGKMYIFTGDTAGNVYIIEGSTGKILIKKSVGSNFESSPIVVNNSVVIGSRGREIFKLSVK